MNKKNNYLPGWRQFLNKNGISSSRLKIKGRDKKIISSIVKANDYVEHYLEEFKQEFENDAPFFLLPLVYRRAYKHISSTLILHITGNYSSAEAMCRVSIEASLNLYCMSLGNCCESIISYVKDYIENERRENKLWKESLEKSSCGRENTRFNMEKIEEKETSLNFYEEVMRGSFKEYGMDYDAISKKFPNVLDRFKSINQELTHRTLYKALCSQIHNDAEDFINDLWHQIAYVDSNTGFISMSYAQHFQEIENKFFPIQWFMAQLNFF